MLLKLWWNVTKGTAYKTISGQLLWIWQGTYTFQFSHFVSRHLRYGLFNSRVYQPFKEWMLYCDIRFPEVQLEVFYNLGLLFRPEVWYMKSIYLLNAVQEGTMMACTRCAWPLPYLRNYGDLFNPAYMAVFAFTRELEKKKKLPLCASLPFLVHMFMIAFEHVESIDARFIYWTTWHLHVNILYLSLLWKCLHCSTHKMLHFTRAICCLLGSYRTIFFGLLYWDHNVIAPHLLCNHWSRCCCLCLF